MRCSAAAALNMLAHQPPLNHSLLSGLLPVGGRVSDAYDWPAFPMSPVGAAARATAAEGKSESTAIAAGKATKRGRARIGRPYSRAPGVSISHPHSLCWLFGESDAAVDRRRRSFGRRGSSKGQLDASEIPRPAQLHVPDPWSLNVPASTGRKRQS